MVLGRSVRALERLLGGFWNCAWGSWRALGCHVGAQDSSEIQKISEKVSLREAGGSTALIFMDFLSKISSPGNANSVFELRNPIVKCRSASST